MNRALRLGLVGAAALAVSGVYALHPRGIALAGRLLLERRELSYGLLLLSQVAIVTGSWWFLGLELAAYGRWSRGRTAPADAAREASWAMARHRFGTPAGLRRTLAGSCRQAGYECRRRWARAGRRWPRKRRELRGWLAQAWTRRVWVGVALVAGGEALTAYLSYRIPGYTLSPARSLAATLLGLAVGNGVAFVGWVAGDDDEGGSRGPSVGPRSPRGHKHPRHARLGPRLSLHVQRPYRVRPAESACPPDRQRREPGW